MWAPWGTAGLGLKLPLPPENSCKQLQTAAGVLALQAGLLVQSLRRVGQPLGSGEWGLRSGSMNAEGEEWRLEMKLAE